MAATVPTTPVPTVSKTCADCRFAATHKRPKIMDSTGFDDQLMFEDTDETVYECKAPPPTCGCRMVHTGEVCGMPVFPPLPSEEFWQCPLHGNIGALRGSPHSGKDIGLVAITCNAWEAPKVDNDIARIDAMIAARDARIKEKEEK